MRESPEKRVITKADGLDSGPHGFSLIELLVATAVGLVVLTSMYGVFTVQNKTLGNQDEIVSMQQSVRAGMDMMVREVGMAGYDPIFTNGFIGVMVHNSQHQIQADLRGVNPNDPPDGIIQLNSEENIVYAYDATNMRITRNIGDGAQPFVENVEAFVFEYLDDNGNVTAMSADVRRIRITITGRTAKPDPTYPANGGYRTYSLTSVVRPQNLAF